VSVFDPPERQYSGFIFDCDGTLADSMPLHHVAWKRALAAAGASFDFHWELFVRRAGKTLEVTVEELNAEFGLSMDPDAVAAQQRSEYDRLFPELRPIEPVVDFLRGIAGRYPASVASGADPTTVRRTLDLLGISDLFACVVTSFEVPQGKPAPDLFLLAAAKMGVPASECLVFEDSPLGIEAAQRAGMGWVLVRSDRSLRTPR